MFDVSFSELLVILLVALVVLGPEKLNGLIRGLGRWLGQAKVYARNITAELERETSALEIKKQLQDARKALEDETAAVEAAARSFEEDMRRGQLQVQNTVQELNKSDTPSSPAAPAAALEAEASSPKPPPVKATQGATADTAENSSEPTSSSPSASEREQRGAA